MNRALDSRVNRDINCLRGGDNGGSGFGISGKEL